MTTRATQGEYAVWHGSKVEYSPVPVCVIADQRLSHAAVRIYSYMLGVVTRPVSTNPTGHWALRRRDIMRQCRIGEEAWTRATRELTSVGLYSGEWVQLEKGAVEADRATGAEVRVGGQWRYVHHVYPVGPGYGIPASQRATPRRATPRLATSRRPTPITHPTTTRPRKTSSSTCARVSDAAAPPERTPNQERKHCTRRASGIDCWTPEDMALAAAIERTENRADIAAAVAQFPVTKAVPGVVAGAIEKIKAERQRELATAAFHVNPAVAAAEAERYAEVAVAEIAALLDANNEESNHVGCVAGPASLD